MNFGKVYLTVFLVTAHLVGILADAEPGWKKVLVKLKLPAESIQEPRGSRTLTNIFPFQSVAEESGPRDSRRRQQPAQASSTRSQEANSGGVNFEQQRPQIVEQQPPIATQEPRGQVQPQRFGPQPASFGFQDANSRGILFQPQNFGQQQQQPAFAAPVSSLPFQFAPQDGRNLAFQQPSQLGFGQQSLDFQDANAGGFAFNQGQRFASLDGRGISFQPDASQNFGQAQQQGAESPDSRARALTFQPQEPLRFAPQQPFVAPSPREDGFQPTPQNVVFSPQQTLGSPDFRSREASFDPIQPNSGFPQLQAFRPPDQIFGEANGQSGFQNSAPAQQQGFNLPDSRGFPFQQIQEQSGFVQQPSFGAPDLRETTAQQQSLGLAQQPAGNLQIASISRDTSFQLSQPPIARSNDPLAGDQLRQEGRSIIDHDEALAQHRLALQQHEARVQAHVEAMAGGRFDFISQPHFQQLPASAFSFDQALPSAQDQFGQAGNQAFPSSLAATSSPDISSFPFNSAAPQDPQFGQGSPSFGNTDSILLYPRNDPTAQALSPVPIGQVGLAVPAVPDAPVAPAFVASPPPPISPPFPAVPPPDNALPGAALASAITPAPTDLIQTSGSTGGGVTVAISTSERPAALTNATNPGQKCVEKVIFVEEEESDEKVECKHSYEKKCHTTYVTTYEPQQDEECEEVFQKDCFIEFKKVAHNATVEFCLTPLVKDCNLDGPTECKTEYETACATMFEAHHVVDDVPDCSIVKEVKCRTVEKGYTTSEECNEWPVQKCNLRTELTKKTTPETKCEKIPRELCAPAGCGFVPGSPECVDKTETILQEMPEETCDLKPRKQCKHVTKLVPKLNPTKECVDIPNEVCQRSKTNPRKIRKPVSKRWCYTLSQHSGSFK